MTFDIRIRTRICDCRGRGNTATTLGEVRMARSQDRRTNWYGLELTNCSFRTKVQTITVLHYSWFKPAFRLQTQSITPEG